MKQPRTTFLKTGSGQSAYVVTRRSSQKNSGASSKDTTYYGVAFWLSSRISNRTITPRRIRTRGREKKKPLSRVRMAFFRILK